MATILEVNQIYLEKGTEWFGCPWNSDAREFLHGSMYRIPSGYTDVSDYRQDNPGVRFVMKGVLFRNFDEPHQPINCTRRPVDITPNELPKKVRPVDNGSG